MTGVTELLLALFLFAVPFLMLGMWVWAPMAGKALARHPDRSTPRARRSFRWCHVRGRYRRGAAAAKDADGVPQPHFLGQRRVTEANSDELVELAFLCLTDLRRERAAPASQKRDWEALRQAEVAWNPFLH